MAKTHSNPERAFGLSVGVVLILIAAFAVWRERFVTAEILGGVGAVLVVLGHFKPMWLYWPSKAWWRMALAMGYVNARVILTVAFGILLVPISMIWRITGKDPMAKRQNNWRGWTAYPPRYRDPNHYSRMY